MVGGKKNKVNKVMPILKILGEKITYIGESGSGQVIKREINLSLDKL